VLIGLVLALLAAVQSAVMVVAMGWPHILLLFHGGDGDTCAGTDFALFYRVPHFVTEAN